MVEGWRGWNHNNGTIWSYLGPLSFVWWLVSWCWSDPVSSNWWTISTVGFFFLHFDSSLTKLFSARKVGLQYHLWVKEIPTVSLWSLLYIFNWPPTFADSLGSSATGSCSCCSSTSKMALILASYNYKIEYHSTGAHVDADSMSRLPLPMTWSPKCENVECYFWTLKLSLMWPVRWSGRRLNGIQFYPKCKITSLAVRHM